MYLVTVSFTRLDDGEEGGKEGRSKKYVAACIRDTVQSVSVLYITFPPS